MIIGTLIYTLAMTMPPGWVKVESSICQRAYGMNLDGKTLQPDGGSIVLRANCFLKRD